MEQTNPAPGVTPGIQSTEYRLANRASWIGIATMVLGILVELAFELVELLTPLAAQLPGSRWLGGVLLVCGAIVKVATSVGYSRSRGLVKASAAASVTKTLVVLLAVLGAAPAFAQEAPAPTRRFGGCTESGFFCAGPSASLSLLTYNLKRQTFERDLTLGAGYGGTFFANRWYATGVNLYGAIRSTEEGGTVLLSLVGSFAEYARFGVGREIVGATGTAQASSSTFLTGGFGLDF